MYAHTTLTLINGGYVCTLTSASELWALEISPGVASLFSGVDRMVIRNRARLGLLPKLSTSAAPALAAFLLPAEPAVSSLGRQTCHSAEARSSVEASDVSVSVN